MMIICTYTGYHYGHKKGYNEGKWDVYWEAVYWEAGEWEVPSFDIEGKPEKYFTFYGKEYEHFHGTEK